MKQSYRQEGVNMMRLGGKVLKYSPDFRLYITTRLRNPHYRPKIAVKVNLSIKINGMEEWQVPIAP
jgi:dynein heavy chain